MFYVNKEVDYALQLISALHKLPQDTVLSLKQFSKESTISFLFLQKIARKLRTADIIKSTKGPKGGYTATNKLNTLNLKQLVEIICGPYGVAKCVTSGKQCDKEQTCTIKPAIEEMNNNINQYLENTNVVTMLK